MKVERMIQRLHEEGDIDVGCQNLFFEIASGHFPDQARPARKNRFDDHLVFAGQRPAGDPVADFRKVGT
jgi:hypothetical protein